jgi:4-hydroxy-tetrahydrodipicolinate reductase
MEKIRVMINGIPGNLATILAGHILNDQRFELLERSLTGPEIQAHDLMIGNKSILLVRPDSHQAAIDDIRQESGSFICVDFTHPSAVNANAEFYCKNNLPFVMGTTGGNRIRLEEMVRNSTIPAVIAPNMAKQIVALQAMMAYAADTFPDLFRGYTLEVNESHQEGKADTSGTARAMVESFNRLGVDFAETEINMERNPEIQKNKWGIPAEHLKGHGWHTYTLNSTDKTVRFQFTHNVNGRDVYAQGTFDAVTFLHTRQKENCGGKVFTMIDVLKGI